MIHILTPEILREVADSHVAIFGKTRVGKSTFLEALALSIAKSFVEGFTFMCPHGTARSVVERIANPESGCARRVVHVLDPNSTMVAGINPFEAHDDSWEAAHDASLLWTSSVVSCYGTSIKETPRLDTNFYVLGMFAAHKKLTLVELLPALSLAGDAIREFLLANFENHAVASVLEDLHQLAARSPARFFEQIDSCKNRLVRWLGDRRLTRILGQQKGLDVRAVMDNREIVCIDTSSLPADDASFLHTLLQCRYFAAAKRRPPHACARHRLIIDEAHASFCDVSAQMLDQTGKFGLYGIYSLQRISQLIEKGPFIASSLMVNAGCLIAFNTPDPENARPLAERLFTGHIDLQEWKPASIRPVAVGNDKVTVRGRSRAQHEAHSQSQADIRSSSWARASAASTASILSSGAAFGTGENISFASLPPDTLFEPGTHVGTNTGRNSASHASSSRAASSARSSSTQHARGSARADARGDSQGTSEAFSQNEAYITRYEDLPTQMFTLEEQLHRLTGEIMTLPRRECFVKLEGRPPFRARTADVPPAFKSIDFKAEWLPRYLTSAAQRSPYLKPAADVDAEIAARLARINNADPRPDTDFSTPEPLPLVDAIERARDFLKDQSPNLRVIEGGGGKDDGDISR